MKRIETQLYYQNYICMIFDYIKKFIFPNRCVMCDELLTFGFNLENEYLCEKCKKKLEFIKEPTCKKCGAMINDTHEMYCARCEDKMWESFEYGFGLLRYNDFVKESIHRIKYEGRKEYIDFYGKCIAKIYNKIFKDINPDYLVPVPIHSNRLKERNYNQSLILAKSISKELAKYNIHIDVNNNLVFRTKDTRVLNKLDSLDRSLELKNAFVASDLTGVDKIVIVDDIYTTGSTINKISEVLKQAGVKKVYFVVISIVDNL